MERSALQSCPDVTDLTQDEAQIVLDPAHRVAIGHIAWSNSVEFGVAHRGRQDGQGVLDTTFGRFQVRGHLPQRIVLKSFWSVVFLGQTIHDSTSTKPTTQTRILDKKASTVIRALIHSSVRPRLLTMPPGRPDRYNSGRRSSVLLSRSR